MKKDLVVSVLLTMVLLPFVNYISSNSSKNNTKELQTEIIEEEIIIKREYGIAIDSFLIEEAEITKGLYLANLFMNCNISNSKISDIIKKTKPVFDVRKIKRGNKYKIFYSKDETEAVSYIVYHQNMRDYIVFDFTDTLNVYSGEKGVRTEMITGSGVINSNLWLTMKDNELNPLLANDLSDIYAWSIDFFGLQKGDKFKIIYEMQYVDDKEFGIGEIKVAYFEHYGKEIYAIPFYQDTLTSFYEINGQSLKKAFLKAPLNYSRISSHFSNSRMHPILKIRRPHHGIDYAAPYGTPVQTIGDGIVVEARYSSSAGNIVKIKHNGVYKSGYLHLSKFGTGITVGAKVKQGDVIGYVGSTGLSTGPHLDFRVWQNERTVDPLKIDAPPVEPIKTENIIEFNKVKEKYIKQLDEIEYKQIEQ